jgi:CubicO group peptidase (beta-lactamase class C family)
MASTDTDEATIDGTCDDRFAAVRSVFEANFAAGLEVGACVAVVIDGETVVDLWGGWVDEAHTAPWAADTITNVWSSTKTMAALCSLVLVDRGELDPDAPVARYWPEFAANGKDGVLVRHILSHTAGLSGWQEPITAEDFADWEKLTSLLAAQAPWWEPGTASGYHAFSQGYLVGEVVRRVAGRSLGTFMAEEIRGPIGADFHIGLAAEHDPRVSLVIPPPPLVPADLDPDGITMRTFSNPPPDATMAGEEWWRRCESPAANGHGNARSLAVAQAAVSHGGEYGGRRLLSPSTLDVIFREQCDGVDLVLGIPLRHGIGYGLPNESVPLPSARSCFWGGWGGSLVVNDLDVGMTFSYVMNRMGEGTVGDERGGGLLAATYAALAG